MTMATGRLAACCGLILMLAGLWPGGPVHAAIPCGTVYEVVRGDTLHRIATRAYGEGNYQAIFRANRELLPDSSSLEVGDRLLIPCLDGTGPQTRAEAATLGLLDRPGMTSSKVSAAPVASIGAAVAVLPDVSLLSGPDFAPFADPRLPEGGMIAELVKLALGITAPDRPTRVVFVDDWSLHLRLLDRGTFDLGLPWYKPDCSHADRLSGSMRDRCTGFLFSAPLFGVEMGVYVRAGDPLAAAVGPDDLHGQRICRPAGYFTFDLDQAGLTEPAVTRVFPASAADCFTALLGGQVDAVSLSDRLAAGEISRLGLDGKVVPVPALTATQTLHAVAPAENAEGRALIGLLDAGIAELKASGRWFEVVSRHLGAFGMTLR